MNKSHLGFTLVELMVSLVLGLIIVGAAFQMLLSGQRSLAFQESIQGLQDNANIGINYVADDIKLTNLNLTFTEIKPNQVSGLIVKNTNYLTGAASTTVSGEGSGSGFITAKSDVLVIQYKPDQTKEYDCEGNSIGADDVIVQRYFIRKDDNGSANDYVLACDAGKYKEGTALTGLNGTGQIIMKGVDLFKVRVGVRDSANNMSYKTLAEFKALSNTSKAVSLQIGILARSLNGVTDNSVEKLEQNIFGSKYSITKPTAEKKKYVWIPVERTIALRNGLGRGAMNKASQKGSTIVVVMVVVILLTIIGAMAMRGSVFGLKIATNSQANNIMDQNNDASFYYIENLDFIKSQLVGTGLFGFPKMADNRNKELVLCYRGGSTKFYQLGKVSLVYSELEGGSEKLKKEHIGGSSNMGFCQVNNSKSDFVSGRGAAMTQISVRVAGMSDDEPFSHYQIGTDAETGKLDETMRVVVTSTTVMPVLSSATNKTINDCMQNLSYIDDPDSDLPTVSECLSGESIPFKTQVAEYSLGQFIKKYVAPPSA